MSDGIEILTAYRAQTHQVFPLRAGDEFLFDLWKQLAVSWITADQAMVGIVECAAVGQGINGIPQQVGRRHLVAEVF